MLTLTFAALQREHALTDRLTRNNGLESDLSAIKVKQELNPHRKGLTLVLAVHMNHRNSRQTVLFLFFICRWQEIRNTVNLRDS